MIVRGKRVIIGKHSVERALFSIDARVCSEEMDYAKRPLLRKQHGPAPLAELRTQIEAVQKLLQPRRAAGKAPSYCRRAEKLSSRSLF
jgi:hypothetical protein